MCSWRSSALVFLLPLFVLYTHPALGEIEGSAAPSTTKAPVKRKDPIAVVNESVSPFRFGMTFEEFESTLRKCRVRAYPLGQDKQYEAWMIDDNRFRMIVPGYGVERDLVYIFARKNSTTRLCTISSTKTFRCPDNLEGHMFNMAVSSMEGFFGKCTRTNRSADWDLQNHTIHLANRNSSDGEVGFRREACFVIQILHKTYYAD